MTYRGRVKNGVIVLESGGCLRVRVDVRGEAVEEAGCAAAGSQERNQLRERLLSFSAVVKEENS